MTDKEKDFAQVEENMLISNKTVEPNSTIKESYYEIR